MQLYFKQFVRGYEWVEKGFTGQITDTRGRVRYFVDGKPVARQKYEAAGHQHKDSRSQVESLRHVIAAIMKPNPGKADLQQLAEHLQNVPSSMLRKIRSKYGVQSEKNPTKEKLVDALLSHVRGGGPAVNTTRYREAFGVHPDKSMLGTAEGRAKLNDLLQKHARGHDVLGEVQSLGKPKVEDARPVDAPKAKEPWEMTKEEHRDEWAKKERQAIASIDAIMDEHRKKSGQSNRGENSRYAKRDKVAEAIGSDAMAGKKAIIDKDHRSAVESALSSGKPVPPEVLADYPDLAEKYDKKADSQPSASSSASDILATVHDTIEELAREKYGMLNDGSVPIHEIRAAVRAKHGDNAASHKVLDPIILQLHKDGTHRFQPIVDLAKATPQQLQDSIPGVGETLFHVRKRESAKPVSSASDAPEPGFTGTDALGREWVNGDLAKRGSQSLNPDLSYRILKDEDGNILLPPTAEEKNRSAREEADQRKQREESLRRASLAAQDKKAAAIAAMPAHSMRNGYRIVKDPDFSGVYHVLDTDGTSIAYGPLQRMRSRADSFEPLQQSGASSPDLAEKYGSPKTDEPNLTGIGADGRYYINGVPQKRIEDALAGRPSANLDEPAAPTSTIAEPTQQEVSTDGETEQATGPDSGGTGSGERTSDIVGGVGDGGSDRVSGERGGEPFSPSIRTGREVYTQSADTGLVAKSVAPHLAEVQLQGAALCLSAMQKNGAAVLADGTGVGKTRQLLAVGQTYLEQGKKVLIIAPKRAAGVETAGKRAGQFAPTSSYANDSKAMGVGLQYAKDDIQPGVINLVTYDNIGAIKNAVDANTVILYDEAHSLKNSTTARGKHSKVINQNAGAVLFATATLGDKAEHIDYLARAGVFGTLGKTETFKKLGMETYEQRIHGGKTVTLWRVNPRVGSEEVARRISGLYDQMTKDGLMIKRELSLDGVGFQTDHVEFSPEIRAQIDDVENKVYAATDGNSALALMAARRYAEPLKIPHMVEQAKRDLAEGRSVVVFAGMVHGTGDDEDADIDGPVREALAKAGITSVGTIPALKKALIEAGVAESDIAELHGDAKEKPEKAMERFQTGKARVVIATPQSGGTGINLDDRVGDKPRSLHVMTPPLSSNEMLQMIGRVHRMTTKSASRIHGVLANTNIDEWNAGILHKKFEMQGAMSGGDVRRGSASFGGISTPDLAEPFNWGESLIDNRHFVDTPKHLNDIAARYGGKRIPHPKTKEWTTAFPSKERYEEFAEHARLHEEERKAIEAAEAAEPPAHHGDGGWIKDRSSGEWAASIPRKAKAGDTAVLKNSKGEKTHVRITKVLYSKPGWTMASFVKADAGSTSSSGSAPAKAVPPMHPKRKEMIHSSLKLLAGLDQDRASEWNGQGYNGFDTHIGHKWAESSSLTDAQAHAAALMLRKYKRQLGENTHRMISSDEHWKD